MVFLAFVYNLALLVSLSANVLATPRPSSPFSMNLHRRVSQAMSDDEIVAWAKWNKLNVEAKYGNPSSIQKRASSGQNLIVNQNADLSFFGSVAVGTPLVAYDVILDTGSADLWLTSSNCELSACQGIPPFQSSSTFQNLSTPFSISYGSGDAAGTLGSDVVQMAGFSVSNQVFAVCDQLSADLLSNPVSGLIGLAFQTISSSKAAPLWETLASSGAWTDPLMAFQLTRYNNGSDVHSLEPGGTFTMGAVNTSLYTGDIDYNNIPNGEGTYWIQTITDITSQGSSISISPGSSTLAAIDTGTSLIGGPADAIAEIYANIPGSEAGTGEFESYYYYPCSTTVEVTISFGGQSWPISNADFKAQQFNGKQCSGCCMGAFFVKDPGGGTPPWIIGDTFLKNVYSVFRYSPPSVGFAQLSSTALAMNDKVDAAIPSPTVGTAAATVSASRNSASKLPSSSILPPVPLMSMAILYLLVLS